MRITRNGVNETGTVFDQLCIQLLRTRQSEQCNCGKPLKYGYQLTHKRYGEDITLNDLELKCGVCHASEHGLASFTGTLRTF